MVWNFFKSPLPNKAGKIKIKCSLSFNLSIYPVPLMTTYLKMSGQKHIEYYKTEMYLTSLHN